ncbi:MAG: DUF4019 domain-containing protein [Sphingobium sp.]|nr:DUF4019 domain-containing protein [Sphingobium sp.]
MTHGYQALTEKEKETLRLLGSGHDAKSMARHLGLSVHTVNERLRDARRKLAVSSSREAARQLRGVEDRTPQLLGDTPLGDASSAANDTQSDHQTERPGQPRRPRWLVGGVVMSFAPIVYALASLSGSAQSAAPTTAATAAETATVAAARQWLTLLDAGDWKASYDATGKPFRDLNTSAVWADTSEHVRAPLGAVTSRSLIAVDHMPAPPHGYWVVKFRTNFANKANAVETLSLSWEDNRWKVVGCMID